MKVNQLTQFFIQFLDGQACKAIAPLFYRTAKNNPNVVFVEVPVTDKNSNLHQGLSVPSLPYGHIYVPSIGLVEEMKINRKYYKQFEEALRRHVRGSCELRDDDCSFPFVIQEGEHVDTFQ